MIGQREGTAAISLKGLSENMNGNYSAARITGAGGDFIASGRGEDVI